MLAEYQCGDYLMDYWHESSDTIYYLLLALPHLPADLQTSTRDLHPERTAELPPIGYLSYRLEYRSESRFLRSSAGGGGCNTKLGATPMELQLGRLDELKLRRSKPVSLLRPLEVQPAVLQSFCPDAV